MKNHIFSIILASVCCAFVACNQNTPDDTKKGGDNTSLNQPSYPATWSPVGHKYVSTDEEYLNREITFLSKDSFLWKREDHQKVYYYKVEYPTIYYSENLVAWLKFSDTLTITRKSDLTLESTCYKLVY